MERMNTRLDRLRGALATRGRTQLGIGPMSLASVDATIDFANEHELPILLIGSRRQIECAAQSGGYVNGWSTETFARYVKERDRGGWVLLCRDHGGPWQNYPEVSQKLPLPAAMASAKASFEVDLASGYDVIHIDPSEHPSGVSPGNVLEMLFELYDFVMEGAQKHRQPILIEIGTEEQNGGLNTPAELDRFLAQVGAFCARRGYQTPTFVVAQTGTLVRETRNVGRFVTGLDAAGRGRVIDHVAELVRVARGHGVFIKEHNGDYLEPEVLAMRPLQGVGATNIAPEFGVAETRFLLDFCEAQGLRREADEFLALALGTRKWEKWLVDGSTATDLDKGIMAGHYVFAMPAFLELRARMNAKARSQGLDLERAVRDHVKAAIARVARPLGLLQ
jgi:hypothetical protein